METSQETLSKVAAGYLACAEAFSRLIDEDVALGCECANPSLQIDCWPQEAPKVPGAT